MVEKISGIEIIPAAASSKLAFTWLKEGKAHIAGSHLEDPKTGEFNLPFFASSFQTRISVSLRLLIGRKGWSFGQGIRSICTKLRILPGRKSGL